MGIVVQQQVAAQVAGVLFTLNPLTGREEEMMIESAWGLGEAVVSGRVNPDTYVIDIDEEKITKRDIASQPMMYAVKESGGIKEVELASDEAARTSLSDAQLLELADLGVRVQKLYGYPQDIEWAMMDGQFVILQTRPMTSFSFDPQMAQWTSGNHREVLPGFPSPLSISLSLRHEYGAALSEVFRANKMGESKPGTEWGRMFFGRPYWNLSEVKRYAAMVPGFKERIFDATVGIEPIYEGDGLVTHWTPYTIARALPMLIALKKTYRDYWREAERYRERFLNEIEPELDSVDPSTMEDEELGRWVRRVFDVHWDTNLVAMSVSFISTQAQDDFEPIMRSLDFDLPPEQRIVEGDLITGLTGVRTAQPSMELWQLSRHALENPVVADTVKNVPPAQMADRLQETPEGRVFWQEVAEFIRRNRYMSPADEDLSLPRWDEEPTFPLATLQAYARSDESTNPGRQLEIQREIRDRTEARAVALLSRGWRRVWPFTHRAFRRQLDIVRRYVWWREEMRVIAARAFYHTRRFAKWLGKRWADQGLLERPEHIFLLYRQHIWKGLEGRLDPAEVKRFITQYLRMKECYRNFDPPTIIGRGVRLETGWERPLGSPEQAIFRGVPCSSGRVEGKARVVHSLEEAHELQRGEILIAPYTNPAWTPLFNLAAGIVIQEGGLLSHGAVVAREYGIPAVVRVEGAVQTFHTGQRLRLDGTAGTVEILPEPAVPPNPLSLLGLDSLLAPPKP
jgi:phosphohistidine swiveling domain-containing protein